MSFEHDVEPILTRAGCNSGPCHGKARGQNGFQLSLLGFDADFDHKALAQDIFGRRTDPVRPEESLVLLKATATLPHGGGKRFDRSSEHYATLRDWIVEGLVRDAGPKRSLERVESEPASLTLAFGERRPLRITARYSDGTTRDVTELATYLSSEAPAAAVDEHGAVKAGPLPGDATILARYRGLIATVPVSIPLPDRPPDAYYNGLPRKSFIDDLVYAKLKQLGLDLSPPADDATFLRRAFFDAIGRGPTADEARTFLADPSPEKREKLVHALLDRPEWADHWATKWMDLLRPNPYRVGMKAVLSLDAWIRASFRRNEPLDRFARAIVTARGSTFRDGPPVIFRDRRSPDEIAPMLSQLLLGVRLECAKCHHHPFESYGQEDFYSLAAYFARVGYKGTGLSPPISGSEEIVFSAKSGSVRHPRTGQELPPRPLFGGAPPLVDASGAPRDPREAFADWMLSSENPYFARVHANRIWRDLMGRGLVEPVDDLRPTNPPSNEPLLDALAKQFRADGFDQKKLLARIMTSHVYGLSSEPTARNARDLRNHSRHYRERLGAEAVLDALCDATGVPEKFAATPAGTRANQLWTFRIESLSLDAFGRPDPNQDPPCQRLSDTNLVQALHLLNAPALHAKVTSDSGRAAVLAQSPLRDEEVVEELYLSVYGRPPHEPERAAALERFKSETRRAATEDLLWAVLNSPEFLFKN